MAQNAAPLVAKYEDKAYLTQAKMELAVLGESYALVQRHKEMLGTTLYTQLKELHADALTVADGADLPVGQKRQTLYHIYDTYFGLLAPLKYAVRSKLKVHKYMNRMRKVIKRGHRGAGSAAFWREFGLKCGVSFAFFITAEILLLWVEPDVFPPWFSPILWLVFFVAMAVYFYYAYQLEGKRTFLGLQKWLEYKTKPAEFEKPMDLWQYAKLAAPLGIAVLSALAKIYIQQ